MENLRQLLANFYFTMMHLHEESQRGFAPINYTSDPSLEPKDEHGLEQAPKRSNRVRRPNIVMTGPEWVWP